MKNSFLFGIFVLLISQLAFANLTKPSLSMLMRNELQTPGSGITPALVETLSGKHVVFVDGIMNGLAKITNNYFYDNIKVIESLGISYDHLGFPSRISVPENAESLFSRIEEIYSKQKKPMILIGHSMGGAEILEMILRHPELLIWNRVERVALIEAAIGGSVLAEKLQSHILARWFKSYLGDGLYSLTREVAHQNFARAFATFLRVTGELFRNRSNAEIEREIQNFSNKIFYVRSSIPAEQELSWGLRRVLNICDGSSLPRLPETIGSQPLQGATENDGLLRVEDQMLQFKPQIGIDLGILPHTDHIQLVVAGIASRSSIEERMAFTRALLQKLYEVRS